MRIIPSLSILFSLPALSSAQTETNKADQKIACLIVRDATNPYFDAMVRSAAIRSKELGMRLQTYTTSERGVVGGLAEAEANVEHIQGCVADGATGLLLSIAADEPGTTMVADAIEAARSESVLAIALDSVIGGVDAVIQTNNTAAGEAVGAWAYATEPSPEDARIALLYCAWETNPNIYERTVGFVAGFGLSTQSTDPNDPTREIDFYSDPRIIGSRQYECSAAFSAKSQLVNILQAHPGKIPTIVYVTNEVGAFGALDALEELELENERVRIMTIDGSCNGVAEVYKGGFDANIIQQPERVAELGLDAIAAFANDGPSTMKRVPIEEKPFAFARSVEVDEDGPDYEYTKTPFEFAVSEQVEGIVSSTREQAKQSCWGSLDDTDDDATSDAGSKHYMYDFWPGFAVSLLSTLFIF